MRHKHKDAIDESVAKYIAELQTQNIAHSDNVSTLCRSLLEENKYLREKERMESERFREHGKEMLGLLNQTGALDKILGMAVDALFSKPPNGWGKSASEPDLESDEDDNDPEDNSDTDTDREDGDLH